MKNTGNFLRGAFLPNDISLGCTNFCISSDGNCNGCERYEQSKYPGAVEKVCKVINKHNILFTKEVVEDLIGLIEYKGV